MPSLSSSDRSTRQVVQASGILQESYLNLFLSDIYGMPSTYVTHGLMFVYTYTVLFVSVYLGTIYVLGPWWPPGDAW